MSQNYNKILCLEIIGFSSLIILILIDELFDLPHLLLNNPKTPFNLAEVIFEVTSAFFLGLFTILSTQKVLKRNRKLRKFYHICASCKRVKLDERWISIEEFLHEHSDADLSHGLCETCMEKYLHDSGLD
ncbi:hypothetical protein [Candidatus Lokiarchaeum ossiferum]|uniref:hypothetical protein n=1 Tax=Candidatus Lokiarchaeum ossiferum TaxID=2951803 RepID=UPI00352E2AF2